MFPINGQLMPSLRICRQLAVHFSPQGIDIGGDARVWRAELRPLTIASAHQARITLH